MHPGPTPWRIAGAMREPAELAHDAGLDSVES